MNASPSKTFLQKRMGLGDEILTEIPPRHAGLIGHDDHLDSLPVEQPDRFRRPGEEFHLVQTAQVADFLVDRAVPVHEDGTGKRYREIIHRAAP